MVSRTENILRSIIDETEYANLPQSRIEELLVELGEYIKMGGTTPEEIKAAINAYMDSHPEIISGVDEDWLRGKLKEVVK